MYPIKAFPSVFRECKEDGTAMFPGPDLGLGIGYYCGGNSKQCSAKICPKTEHPLPERKNTAAKKK